MRILKLLKSLLILERTGYGDMQKTMSDNREKLRMNVFSTPQPENVEPLLLTSILREAKIFMRFTSISGIFLLVHALLFSHLAVAADAHKKQEAENQIVLQGSPEQQLNEALLKIQELADAKNKTIADRLVEESGLFDSVMSFFGLSRLQLEELDSLEQLNELLSDLNQKALEGFQQTEALLVEKQVSESKLQTHRETVAQYQQRFEELREKLAAVLQSEDLKEQGEAIESLNELMAPQKLKKGHQFSDPNNLPWGTPDASKTREPAKTADELSARTGISPIPQGTQLAANIITPDMLGRPGGPIAEDLIETPDIKFTDAIKAKALELEENPVKIYNWVRNNIEFIPSYGSIQGADYTLQHGKGNAFDTASLLIALLRASNIPARYAYGTVNIPVEKVMNWVGGVEVPGAAQQLLGQGGIPNVGLVKGGKVTDIRIEQIWVEVWADYFPSRAAKHIVGDSWIPLDASFKQYEYTEGQAITSDVPLDDVAIREELNQNATLNVDEGWVQGIDLPKADSGLQQYLQQVEDFFVLNRPDIALEDVLGSRKTILQETLQLASGLPYQVESRTHNYSTLPDSLRHKFRYTLATNSFGIEGNRLINIERSLPELAGKKLSLSFGPASQQDEDLLLSYLPTPDPDTGEIDLDQVPDSFPAYLIDLNAEFAVDGEVIESSASGAMGSELLETISLWSPAFGYGNAVNHPVAGEYRAIGLNLQGDNQKEALARQQEVEATIAKLEAMTGQAGVVNLTKQEFVGDMLNAVIHNYFSINDTLDKRTAAANGLISYRAPSFGLFASILQTSYFFGVPRNISFAGFGMDVDRLATQVVAKNNDREMLVGYVKGVGVMSSAMEHLVPELMFNLDNTVVEGISAIKALNLAAAEGQRIWTIDKSNLTAALAALNLDRDIETEIRNSVNAGNIATAHENPVSLQNTSSVGYLLTDPETGGGAYKIAGGANGSIVEWLDENASWLGGIAFVLGLMGGAAAALGIALGVGLAYAGFSAFSGTNPDPTLLLTYVALMATFVILGAILPLLFAGATAASTAAIVGGGLFGLWIFGFMADGAIRAAQNAINALRSRLMP